MRVICSRLIVDQTDERDCYEARANFLDIEYTVIHRSYRTL